MTESRRVLLCGVEEAPPARIPLRAGPLTMVFEPETSFLRTITLSVAGHPETEVLRAIYAAVRDHDWNTLVPRVTNLECDQRAASFSLQFDATCGGAAGEFAWHGTIQGDAEGRIRFAMDGVVKKSFRRNRIGFCVLHPVSCAGLACTVEEVDGMVSPGEFPRRISPHQPFKNMRAIAHEVVPGIEAEVRFEGDTFEMEDQRNWTDASFKTYCTPLDLPFPVAVSEGTKVTQSVTVRLPGYHSNGAPVQPLPEREAPAISVASRAPLPLPAIGVGMASHGEALGDKEVERLAAIGLRHLRVDVRLSEPEWRATLERGVREARSMAAALELALTVGDDAATQLDRLHHVLVDLGHPVVDAFLIFHEREESTAARWIELARERLCGPGIRTPIVSGTNAFFTELNRERPPIEPSDGVCYSINPQAHAFDNASLVETLSVQAETVASAREFCGGLPVRVTPVTLRARFNPNATSPADEPPAGALPPQVDVRQMSLLGAAWTLGSLRHLCRAGAESVTYFETSGWRGVLEREAGSPLPELFRSVPGGVFPLYHVLADVCEYDGGSSVACENSLPLACEALALEHGDRRRVIVANLTEEDLTVRVDDPRLLGSASLRLLDDTTVGEAVASPEAFRARTGAPLSIRGALTLHLRPFAVATIDAVQEEG